MFQIIRESKYEHIEKFVLYGERHCGTKFLQQSLECFNIRSTQYFGHKHWFGFADLNKIQFEMHTMFICIVRNPYSWISAFFDMPHRVIHRNRQPLESFMLSEWQSINMDKSEILQDRDMNNPSKRYANIFEMRSTKINYMINVLPNYARNFIFLKYEDLTNNYINVMKLIQNKFNLTQHGNFPISHPVVNRRLETRYKQIIDSNLNWSIENAIGYNNIY